MNLDEIDVYNPDLYVKGLPHDQFKVLRAKAPVFHHKEPAGPGYWALTKYNDIVAVSKDPGTFSSHRGGTNIEDYPADQMIIIQTLMLNMDPPQHGKFRRLVSQAFTPRMVEKLEPRIRETVNEILDRAEAKGECDFVREISAELPLQVIAELMGIPVEDRAKLFDWSNRLIGFDDPEFQTSPDDGAIAASELWQYANGLAENGGLTRPDGLVNALLNASIDGEKLTEMEFDSFFLLLTVAGNETTRNLISGGMLALLEHPDQLARLQANPALLNSAVEEMLRWVTPVMYFRRTLTRDVEIRGQKLKEGEKVAMYYGSANRDEDVFPDGDVFDVGRTPNDHLAFGIGEHFCLGTSLARLEIRLLFEGLIARFPKLRLNGPVRRLRSNFINGVKAMPVILK